MITYVFDNLTYAIWFNVQIISVHVAATVWCVIIPIVSWLAGYYNCDWIWENPASMHNYKYLEIPI